MNWGYRIFLVYSTFVVGMVFMVYKCTQQNIDLVTDNYYNDEIKYQSRMNESMNSNDSKYHLSIALSENKRQIVILFPDSINNKEIDGVISFFKPDNAQLDFNVPISISNGNTQVISEDKMAKGLWKMKISWSIKGVNVYQEEKVTLQ